MGYLPIEETEVFQLFVKVADEIWDIVLKWSYLSIDTIGKQIIRSADSIGANLAEGEGRSSDADRLHFFIIARASARETRYWLQRARHRHLIIEPEYGELVSQLEEAAKMLNQIIAYRRTHQSNNKKSP